MKVIDRVTHKVETLNGRLLGAILKVGLPRYGKKLVFIASLFVGLKGKSSASVPGLTVLNEELKLASCTEALEFPAMFSQSIWGSCDLNHLTPGCVEDTSRDLVNHVPSWLQYAPIEQMVQDTMRVVTLARPTLS